MGVNSGRMGKFFSLSRAIEGSSGEPYIPWSTICNPLVKISRIGEGSITMKSLTEELWFEILVPSERRWWTGLEWND